MNDKLYIKKGMQMKSYLLILVMGMLLLSGCSGKNEGVVIDNKEEQNTLTNLKNSDFLNENALHDAVRARDMNTIQFLIDQKIDLNNLNSEGYTALHIAVRLEEFEIVKLLVEEGAAVNSVDRYKDMPLIDSTRDNYTEISKFLICHGAKRNVVDRYKMSPLNNSVKNMNLEVSEMLLAENLDPYCLSEEELIASEEVLEEETNEVAFVGLYDALMEEFKDDFSVWNAELTKDDLVFRFNNPIALFEHGKSDLKVGFEDILSDFFPRYLKILEEYQEQIKEVAIEGHTSSEYKNGKTEEEKYQLNEKLSTKRANTVKEYLLNKTLELNYENNQWLQDTFNSYGRSSSDLILNEDGTENIPASRRVDFRIFQLDK